MANFPRIKIGTSSRKKSKFDLSYTNNTTAEFGAMQPILHTELCKDESIEVNINDFVRLAPMPQPTFAKGVTYKKYAMFVPYEDMYKPFANLLSNKPYNSGVQASYVPSSVPHCSQQDLFLWMVWLYGDITTYKAEVSSSTVSSYNLSKNTTGLAIVTNFLGRSAAAISDRIHYPTPDSSTFVENYDYTIKYSYAGSYYVICINLNRFGRLLRKILIGLGYKPSYFETNADVSLLPLMAYYKAYFDIFYPQRNITWTDTYLYELLSYIANVDYTLIKFTDTTKFDLICNFFDDLVETFYTYEPDYFSAQLGSAANGGGETIGLKQIDGVENGAIKQDYGALPSIVPHLSAMTNLTQPQMQLLERLTKYVNKNTVIGGKIADYLRAHGLGQYVDEHYSNFCGASQSDIQVFDVDQTSASIAHSPLGTYVGKGVGKGQSKFTFKANCFGSFIVMSCIVPEVGYCQGTDPNLHHLTKFDYYHPEFDTVGLQSTRKSDLFTPDNWSAGTSWSQAFGLVPRYSEMKQKQNIINGDFTLQSRRDGLLGYTLDRFIIKDLISTNHNSGTVSVEVKEGNNISISNGTAWRYCNLYRWMGNFDRMFYNQNNEPTKEPTADRRSILSVADRYEDNFIIHHYINFIKYSPMIPIADAYNTGAEEESTTNVQKQ